MLQVDTILYSYRTLPNLVKDLGVLAKYSTRLKKSYVRLKPLRSCIFLQTVELIVSPLLA